VSFVLIRPVSFVLIRPVSFVLIRPAQLPVLPVDTGGMPA
jgi:hypothetical protein